MLLGASFVAMLVLALIHLFSGRLRFLQATPRSAALSVFGGVSVAYVFVHLLPELARYQDTLATAVGERLPPIETHAYLVALLGLVVFYGVERTAAASRKEQVGADSFVDAGNTPAADDAPDTTSQGVFALSIGSFAVYNVVIGYLLVHREKPGLASLVLFAAAMGLHFVVNDFGLRSRHRRAFTRLGRWILMGAVLLGWGIGVLTEISDAVIALLVAFLSGGVVLNVLKEELPEERQSHFWAFLLGVVGYTAILLAV